MNCKRFTARTSREALTLVRQAFGEDAVVLSTKPCAEGVEVLAMAPEGMAHIEQISATAPKVSAPAVKQTPPARKGKGLAERIEPEIAAPVEDDVRKLSMSTLSFQDFVRERMLKRRQEAMSEVSRFPDDAVDMPIIGSYTEVPPAPPQAVAQPVPQPVAAAPLQQRMSAPAAAVQPPKPAIAVPVLHDTPAAEPAAPVATRRDQEEMIRELRQVKGLIEERFGALAFMEKLQRQPAQARLTQKLLDAGFSPALIRKLAEAMPHEVSDEMSWAASVLERNILTGEVDGALEDQGGVYAMVGATGVGKTTSTAKIAAAFAAKYGAGNLGLITLDAYRLGAHEQLRAYGRILGVPVHTAHDRASLEDLLELLAGKKMVLIDTAGMAQRDSRTRELLDMLQHRAIKRLLVVNAASQGETIEDVLVAYRAASCAGVVLSKLDEAVKLGPALDALIRHKLKVVGVANGQRVPEDWHRLSANALTHRALRGGGSSAYKLDSGDVNLIFAAPKSGLLQAAAAH
ncbi:MAG: flagellar biosynthesis protein FlhF [Piscinibacter sp.]|uniref:flagellar biosynthesis protein FlhF n=1 Tax=Piscinibacter sp. TaxID=1903157 RepID=UPI001B3F0C9F|nr:flagellar biosynthesis protein FlhF [Piscinibacter sp.]MBP5991008.1 flagellar biosynthesis protein FlhF [Piscinibacter sp.]MBP6028100.1 flagellar biosynthesis protein FlhF [Piscinibacter sp.]